MVANTTSARRSSLQAIAVAHTEEEHFILLTTNIEPTTTMSSHATLTSTYRARSGLPTTGALASYLLSLMSIKHSNLCLSADVETSAELLQLAEDVGDSICLLKTHCDIVTDWTDRTAQALREIAKRKRFLIFEDRKFADIGGTSLPESLVTPSFESRATLWSSISNLVQQKRCRSSTHRATTASPSGPRSQTHTSYRAPPS